MKLPPGGNKLIFTPGSTAKIEWSYDEKESSMVIRVWSFTSGGGTQREVIASIIGDDLKIANSSLPGVAIIKPATLVLINVDLRYNGTYRFSASKGRYPDIISDVAVFIAGNS